jgi:hypothetical protein
VTFLVWGGLALAVGMRWPLALAAAVLTGACALVCTAVIVAGDAVEEEPEGHRFARPESNPRAARWN